MPDERPWARVSEYRDPWHYGSGMADSDDPPRKRLRRIEAANQARFLTCSCYGRLPLLNHDGIRALLAARIGTVRETHRFALVAWVLMPEHFHLLVVPDLPNFPIPALLHAIKRPVAEQVLRRWRTLDAPILRKLTDGRGARHYWQPGGGHDRNVRDAEELADTISYVHRNPVERGLVEVPTDWPWSSARWYAGREDDPGQLPIDRF